MVGKYVKDGGEGVVGEGGRGMRSCCPTTPQILGPPGFWLLLESLSLKFALTVFSYESHINSPVMDFQEAFFHETICMNNIG